MEQTLKVNGIIVDRISEEEAKGAQFIGILKNNSYKELTEKLGQPTKVDDGKTRIQWVIRAEGIVFCIYDYRDSAIEVGMLKNWHIGSNRSSEEAAPMINRLFFNKF